MTETTTPPKVGEQLGAISQQLFAISNLLEQQGIMVECHKVWFSFHDKESRKLLKDAVNDLNHSATHVNNAILKIGKIK